MEPSEEIRRVIHRWMLANADGDADAVIGKISELPGMLAVGTDADEWWHAQERPVWRRQIEEAGGFPVTWGEIEAWEEGTVGWAGMRMTFHGPETSEARATFVLHLERGEWKIVQTHWSLPTSNEDVLGMTLTVSLDQLEKTIQRERPDLSGNLAADGTVTIVFTDIVDSTVLTTRLGDHAWLELLRTAQHRYHGGHRESRRDRGRNARRRLDARLFECASGGRLCAGDPAGHRRCVRGRLTAYPRQDRRSHRRRAARG